MQCPTDGATLVMSERSGIEIDYCPTCRGVWLDRGELDKILVKERQLSSSDPDEDFYREMEGRRPTAPPPPARDHNPRHDSQRYDDKHYKKKKRRSFLEDLLDFD
jgi:Zn-finger nucleic acid-binding protein